MVRSSLKGVDGKHETQSMRFGHVFANGIITHME